MITDIVLDRSALKAGETRYLQAYGEEPLTVDIHCFAQKPPPPGYKPCKECGAFKIRSGQALAVTATSRVFADHGGRLEITIRDNQGDVREIRLVVVSREADHGAPAPAAAGA